MTNYRRLYVPGGTYFFTVALQDRRTSLLTDHIDLLRGAFRTVKRRRPFEILAICVLPEHLHTVWRLPEGDSDYSVRWKQIKSHFSYAVPRNEPASASRMRKGERGIWQRRFWEHWIRDEEDLRRHIDYVHFNPQKHGLVEDARDWPYSSYRRYLLETGG